LTMTLSQKMDVIYNNVCIGYYSLVALSYWSL
jgi:hypothetical protein